MAQVVIVFVPGIMGTQLTAPWNLQSVWPDQVVERRTQAVQLLTQPKLEAGVVLRWILSTDIYGGFVDFFAGANFKVVNSSDSLPDTTDNVVVMTGYDWLLSNSTSAAVVDATLTAVAAAYPDATLWLVAHSMGGLVSRYVIESGAFASPSYTIAGLVTIATPHLGVPLALSAITGEANTNSLLNAAIIEELVDWPLFTSVFEMLPPSASFVFDAQGNALSIWSSSSPVYQLLTSSTGFDAPVASFTAATTFTGSLDFSSSPNNRPDYYLVYGSTLATPQSFLYDANAGTPQTQLMAQSPSTANDGGDGTVPVSSASFANGWSTATFDAGALTHGELPNSTAVLDQVLTWITG